MITPSLTRQKAEAHEALYPALEKLAAQVEAIASRKPAAAVPAATGAIAADLLFEAQRFLGLRRGLPEVAADLGGLATQLGRALAGLDAFETAHSAWHPEQKCFVWLLRDPMPVKRLRQVTHGVIKTARDLRLVEERRRKIMRRFEERFTDGYEAGYKDASSGHEPRPASA